MAGRRWSTLKLWLFVFIIFGSSATQAEATEPFLQMRIAYQLPNADRLAALEYIPALGGLRLPQLRLPACTGDHLGQDVRLQRLAFAR